MTWERRILAGILFHLCSKHGRICVLKKMDDSDRTYCRFRSCPSWIAHIPLIKIIIIIIIIIMFITCNWVDTRWQGISGKIKICSLCDMFLKCKVFL